MLFAASALTTLRTDVLPHVLAPDDCAALDDDDTLLDRLDSLQLLRLAVTLEETYGIKVGNDELTPENLGSLARLDAFVSRKLDVS